MTTLVERTRALVWAGGFLIELARDRSLPLEIRKQAVVIARHFPTIEDISAMALLRYPIGYGARWRLSMRSMQRVKEAALVRFVTPLCLLGRKAPESLPI